MFRRERKRKIFQGSLKSILVPQIPFHSIMKKKYIYINIHIEVFIYVYNIHYKISIGGRCMYVPMLLSWNLSWRSHLFPYFSQLKLNCHGLNKLNWEFVYSRGRELSGEDQHVHSLCTSLIIHVTCAETYTNSFRFLSFSIHIYYIM